MAAGANHRTGFDGLLLLGIGDVAEVGLGVGEMVLGRETRAAQSPSLAPYAVFRMGVEDEQLFAGALAIALGFRHSLAGGVRRLVPASAEVDVANLDLSISKRLGAVELTLGARVWHLRAVDADGTSLEQTIEIGSLANRIRPAIALSWAPAPYPKTRLLLDLSSVSWLDDNDAGVKMQGAWGVRYHALSWAHIELLVRHVESEGLDDSTVFVRLAVVRPRSRR